MTDPGVIGILITHLGAFGSGELKARKHLLVSNRKALSLDILVAASSTDS